MIGVGYVLKGKMKSSEDFFLSGHNIPSWVTGLAFLSANLGAIEVMGMAANAAQYGVMTAHFYWIGAIPAMVFLAIFMMPFYYGSKVRSVPEYLKNALQRTDQSAQCNFVCSDDCFNVGYQSLRHGIGFQTSAQLVYRCIYIRGSWCGSCLYDHGRADFVNL